MVKNLKYNIFALFIEMILYASLAKIIHSNSFNISSKINILSSNFMDQLSDKFINRNNISFFSELSC